MDALAGLDLLAGATPDQLADLAAGLGPARDAAGETLIAECDGGRTFVIVLNGDVVASRASRSRPGLGIELGTGSRGALFGELSTVTGEPRRATVTATTDVETVVGDIDAFDALIGIPGVMDRLLEPAPQRLAEIARPVAATLRDGTHVWLRPLLARDRDEFSAAIARQTDDWRHRRFFTAVKPSSTLIEYLTHLDYLGHFAWAVGAPHPVDGIGTARFIRSHDDPTTAELGFEVADEWRGRGIGTLLLGALGAAAAHIGIETFRAEVLYENRAMRSVMNKAGAHWEHADTGGMQTAFPVVATRALVPADQWDALGAVTEEICEVAGLALWRGATG